MNKSTTTVFLAPLALAVVLGVGAAVAWAAAVLWLGFVVTQIFFPPPPVKQVFFSPSGEAVIRLFDAGGVEGIRYRTLDGRLIENPESLDLLGYATALSGPGRERMEQPSWMLRVIGYRQAGGVPTFWYLFDDGHPRGHAYFVGISPYSKRVTGYIGLHGFRDDPPPADERFAIGENRMAARSGFAARGMRFSMGSEPRFEDDAGNTSIYVVSGDALYDVNLRRQTVRPMTLADKVVSIGLVSDPHDIGSRDWMLRQRLAVRFSDRVILFDADGKELRSIELPQEVRGRTVTVYETTGPESIVLDSRFYETKWPADIYWIDSQGRVARHELVFLDPEQANEQRMGPWAVAIAMPSPVALALGVFVTIPLKQVAMGRSQNYSAAVVEEVKRFALPLLLVGALSALSAIVAYRHARRFGLANAIPWTVFVLVTGVPGLAGYWLHRRWPAMERCAKCGAVVSRDREECLACAAEFPPPALTGVEVFA